MARDYTKYTVEGLGENMNKRQLVFTIVKDWASKNKPSLEDIQTTFPDDIQGSKGFVVKASEVKDAKRFNMREPLSIKNGTKVVVSNQWGTENVNRFVPVAKKLGYAVTAASKTEATSSKVQAGGKVTFYVQVQADSGDAGPSFEVEADSSKDSLAEEFKALNAECNFDTLYYVINAFNDTYIDEMYKQLINNATNPEGLYGGELTIADLKDPNFDWFEICPHFVITKIGDLDLTPIDEASCWSEDEDILEDAAELLKKPKDEIEDWASDFMTNVRFSLEEDTFKTAL
jgi:hypothetical protein